MKLREHGQAAVETAIILPLFLFLILGMLQYGLMTQARVMTKYAAFRAARAGALFNADPKKMEEAALAALIPAISDPAGGNVHGAEVIKKADDPVSYGEKYMLHSLNRMLDYPLMKYADVTICGPLQGDFK